MKKFTYLKRKLAIFCLLTLPIFFTACQEEEITSRNSNLETTTSLAVASGNCRDNCIDAEAPHYYPTTDLQTVPATGQTSKTVEIKYYNTETHFFVEVQSSRQWSNLQIYNETTGVWNSVLSGNVAANSSRSYSYPLANGWQPCTPISFRLRVVGGGGNPVDFLVNYELIGICDDGCATSFTGEAISCDDTREAVYTFTTDADQEYIKIQGGLTNFTGADAVVTVSNENLEITQSTPGGSSNRIIKVEGPVSECETITIRITWNSTNNGGIITGDWSIKNGDGLELAPSVPGLQCD
ncbi:hypothetical protein FLJC2902T_30970 [Flavobacterium limnosediminis JC2902]|uniref:Lipoprotein n=1 Tax=Flavobacterium limnosediminis JC2902 TaxID=1341181 RepID=V6SFR3_9FLAO|nr:hypothetical protein [Flavobacterium limnosediminis]ESU25289.1 hypothetical protein FLJC2902T_30970 [Flavobacterium limnosediminis JC2902]